MTNYISKKAMQELLARTALTGGLTVTEVKENKLEFAHIIKNCLILYFLNNGVPQRQILESLGFSIRTNLSRYNNQYSLRLKNDPDYKFWYDEIKRIHKQITLNRDVKCMGFEYDRYKVMQLEMELN